MFWSWSQNCRSCNETKQTIMVAKQRIIMFRPCMRRNQEESGDIVWPGFGYDSLLTNKTPLIPRLNPNPIAMRSAASQKQVKQNLLNQAAELCKPEVRELRHIHFNYVTNRYWKFGRRHDRGKTKMRQIYEIDAKNKCSPGCLCLQPKNLGFSGCCC